MATLATVRVSSEHHRMIPDWMIQVIAVAVVIVFAPLYKGVINRWKARIQSRRGPSYLQPYFDLQKLFRKDMVVSRHTSWVFHLVPLVYFVVPVVFATLIPVLAAYPLPLAEMGDILGSGFVLALGGFFISLGALDAASTYGGMGSSRARVISFLSEPVLILVFFTIALIASTDLPFFVNRALVDPKNIISPAHLLVAVSFFMVVLAETGRIPLDNPATGNELSMIDGARILEYSGPELALLEWGGAMKMFVLLVVLMNVLVVPAGLTYDGRPLNVLIAVLTLLLKMAGICAVIVAIESSFAKFRFFRIPEFLGVAFTLSLLALITYEFTKV
ncbi:MAG: respiratory chain complex I subunit 1 family protein [Chloroflexota bacterium]